jgi:hypothetical protein
VIRRSTRGDIPAIVALGERFWYESDTHSYFGEFDSVCAQRALYRGFSNESLLGWVSLGSNSKVEAFIVLGCDNALWNDSTILREVLWYADENKRGSAQAMRLFATAHKYAVENDYNHMIMTRIKGVPSYNKLDAFYKRCGFSLLEENYIKNLR